MSILSTAGLATLSVSDALGVAAGLPNEKELNAVDDAADDEAPNEKRPAVGSFGLSAGAGAAIFGVSISFGFSAAAGFSSFFVSSGFFSLAGVSFFLLKFPNEKVAVGAALMASLLPNENDEPVVEAPNPWLPPKLPNENCCDDVLAMALASLLVEVIASFACSQHTHFDLVASFLVMHAVHSHVVAFCLAAIDLNMLSVAGLDDGCDGVDDDDGKEPNEKVFCGVPSALVVALVALPFGSPQHTHFVADASFGTKHILQSHFELESAAFVAVSSGANGFGAVDDAVATEALDGLSLPQHRHFFADLSLDTKHDAHSHFSCFCFSLIDLNSVFSQLSSVEACDKRTAASSLLDIKPVDLLTAEPNECVVSAKPLSDVMVFGGFGSNRRLPRLVFVSNLVWPPILSSTNIGLLNTYGFRGTVTL